MDVTNPEGEESASAAAAATASDDAMNNNGGVAVAGERGAEGESGRMAAATTMSGEAADGDMKKSEGAPPDDGAAGNDDDIVPQLSDFGVTRGDLETAVKVLNAVASLHPSSAASRRKKKQQGQQQQSSRTPSADGSGEKEADDGAGGGKRKQDEALEAYKRQNLRQFRKALAGCIELHRLTMFNGKEEERHYRDRVELRSLKRQKTAERDTHRRYIEATQLRQGRVDRLRKLQGDAADEEQAKLAALSNLVPDGHVETTAAPLLTQGSGGSAAAAPCDPAAGAAASGETGDCGGGGAADNENGAGSKQLPQLRSCYVCKVRYRELHHFYDQLCPGCAALNWEKRHQTCDLRDKVAVVTGARVKIGFQTCLKLLRAGCVVVATTRFPNSAVDAYRRQPGFETWKSRLHVYGLDLRDVTGLEAFTRFLKVKFGASDRGIDILINNACQTVRRPVQYYRPIVERERSLWTEADNKHKAILQGCLEFERLRRKLDLEHKNHGLLTGGGEAAQLAGKEALLPPPDKTMVEDISVDDATEEVDDSKPTALVASSASTGNSSNIMKKKETIEAPFESSGLSHSAAMSQMILLPDDVGVSDSVLPPGLTDVNNQQLDLRTTNSWLLKMDEISTPEVMECMFVNAIAPFVLNSRLKPLMTIPNTDARPDRYIINVSAMEGKFYRYKMPNHPHTNMAKSALNMLTRTSSEDLAKKNRIFMNSVDTGWINDENPLERAKRTAVNNNFQTPIDEIDAAARILDPIFTGVIGGPGSKKEYGKFLKDYRESEW